LHGPLREANSLEDFYKHMNWQVFHFSEYQFPSATP
jgi:hypothetical protein